MNGNTTFCARSIALLPLFAIAIADFAMPREAYGEGWLNGVPFQQTDSEIIEEHYQGCLEKNPKLTRAEAAKLDQQCNPLTPRPAMSPEELKALEDSLNAAMMRSKQAN